MQTIVIKLSQKLKTSQNFFNFRQGVISGGFRIWQMWGEGGRVNHRGGTNLIIGQNSFSCYALLSDLPDLEASFYPLLLHVHVLII